MPVKIAFKSEEAWQSYLIEKLEKNNWLVEPESECYEHRMAGWERPWRVDLVIEHPSLLEPIGLELKLDKHIQGGAILGKVLDQLTRYKKMTWKTPTEDNKKIRLWCYAPYRAYGDGMYDYEWTEWHKTHFTPQQLEEKRATDVNILANDHRAYFEIGRGLFNHYGLGYMNFDDRHADNYGTRATILMTGEQNKIPLWTPFENVDDVLKTIDVDIIIKKIQNASNPPTITD